MGNSQHNINVAQVALYIILAIPTLFILIKHHLAGLLGWLYLFIFCTLRLVGGALALSNPADQTAAIISSIGLSPLLLAAAGILHEARRYRNPALHKKIEFILVLSYHILVTAGLALVASASSAFSPDNKNSKGDENLLKVGIVILLVSWVVSCVWGLWSWLSSPRDAPAFVEGTKLLYSFLFALPFIGMRVLYSTASLLAPSKNLSAVHAAIGLKIALSFLPELIAAIGFVVLGITTRNIRRVENDGKRVEGLGLGGMARGKEGDLAERQLV